MAVLYVEAFSYVVKKICISDIVFINVLEITKMSKMVFSSSFEKNMVGVLFLLMEKIEKIRPYRCCFSRCLCQGQALYV